MSAERASEGAAFNVGLLGFGTVGAAFAELLEQRAGEIAGLAGREPRLVGVLTRKSGDFQEILGQSDLIVELMGGVQPAREYVLAALQSGRHVVTANKLLLSQHGEELHAAAERSGVQLL